MNAYRKATFLTSASSLDQLPPDTGLEVAFAGRSNSGKSSALNAITGRKRLARISKTPGRTQLINVFPFSESMALVDLPGYGYARVPAKLRDHWQRTLPAYLARRQALQGLMLIMDIRHPLREFDRQLLSWSQHAGLPVHILLSKCDKLRRGPARSAAEAVRRVLRADFPGANAQLFSAESGEGVDAARAVLDRWFGLAEAP